MQLGNRGIMFHPGIGTTQRKVLVLVHKTSVREKKSLECMTIRAPHESIGVVLFQRFRSQRFGLFDIFA